MIYARGLLVYKPGDMGYENINKCLNPFSNSHDLVVAKKYRKIGMDIVALESIIPEVGIVTAPVAP